MENLKLEIQQNRKCQPGILPYASTKAKASEEVKIRSTGFGKLLNTGSPKVMQNAQTVYDEGLDSTFLIMIQKSLVK